jgi:hypothetical protein
MRDQAETMGIVWSRLEQRIDWLRPRERESWVSALEVYQTSRSGKVMLGERTPMRPNNTQNRTNSRTQILAPLLPIILSILSGHIMLVRQIDSLLVVHTVLTTLEMLNDAVHAIKSIAGNSFGAPLDKRQVLLDEKAVLLAVVAC